MILRRYEVLAFNLLSRAPLLSLPDLRSGIYVSYENSRLSTPGRRRSPLDKTPGPMSAISSYGSS